VESFIILAKFLDMCWTKALQYVFVKFMKDEQMRKIEVVNSDRENGVHVILRYVTERGTVIYALGVPVSYESGGDWDLGPTWCYVVQKDPVTLIDAGQWGKFDVLKMLLQKADIEMRDIKRVIITHGHEDHDGNVPEVVEESGASIWAHFAYENMISYHPDIKDGARHPDFPGSCRTCMMPDAFNRACMPYHRKRSRLKLDFKIDNEHHSAKDYRFICTPGHSPDSLCIVFEDEVVFGGDTVLATITPHPSLALEYYVQRRILPGEYGEQNNPYGLMAYIDSLRSIIRQCSDATILFPGHRLFEGGRVNRLKPVERALEIIRFHKDRCSKILDILGNRVLTLEEMAVELFPPRLRRGYGRFLSQREVMSHLELLAVLGDIEWVNGPGFKSKRTGTCKYKKYFKQEES